MHVGVCLCAFVWDVSVLLLPVGGTRWCGGWMLSGSVELARISDSLCETASHLLKEIMKSQTATLPINVHVSALLNSSAFAACDYLPPSFIHLWRGEKNVPLRIFVCEKLLSVNNQKTGKLNRQESQKKSGIIMSWITCCIDSTDGGKQLWLFYFTLPACCCAPATLFCC